MPVTSTLDAALQEASAGKDFLLQALTPSDQLALATELVRAQANTASANNSWLDAQHVHVANLARIRSKQRFSRADEAFLRQHSAELPRLTLGAWQLLERAVFVLTPLVMAGADEWPHTTDALSQALAAGQAYADIPPDRPRLWPLEWGYSPFVEDSPA
jgi:hypothetical protein